jgi:hypothetical protein
MGSYMAVRLSALRTGRTLLPSNITSLLWYSFLSEPQGLAWLEGLGKLNEIHSPHRVSNLRPFGLFWA